MWKICSKCKKHKSLWKFNISNLFKFGVRCSCKACEKEYRRNNKKYIAIQKKKYREDNEESIKNYQKNYNKNNKEKLSLQKKKYNKDNKEYKAKYDRKYRKDNIEYYKKKGNKYRKNNKESIILYQKKYYKVNKENLLLYQKNYKINNSYKYNTHSANYRALKLNQTPKLTTNEKAKIALYYKISDYMGNNWHVDHIKPLSKGGLHHPDNLQIIPAKHNLSKNNNENYIIPKYLILDI